MVDPSWCEPQLEEADVVLVRVPDDSPIGIDRQLDGEEATLRPRTEPNDLIPRSRCTGSSALWEHRELRALDRRGALCIFDGRGPDRPICRGGLRSVLTQEEGSSDHEDDDGERAGT